MKNIEGLVYVEDGILTVAIRSSDNILGESSFFDGSMYVMYNDIYPGHFFSTNGVCVIPDGYDGWTVKSNGKIVGSYIPVNGGVSFGF